MLIEETICSAFIPWRICVKGQGHWSLVFQKKDYKRVEKAMESFLQMQEMTSLVGSDLKKGMDQNDLLTYPLLQW